MSFPKGDTPAIEVDDLTIRYGDHVAVAGLSFRAEPGRITALLGPNGAGKTSTVETLEGYRSPTSGKVRVLGLDPRRDHAALVGRIGVMLQSGGVYTGIRPLESSAFSPATTRIRPILSNCWTSSVSPIASDPHGVPCRAVSSSGSRSLSRSSVDPRWRSSMNPPRGSTRLVAN